MGISKVRRVYASSELNPCVVWHGWDKNSIEYVVKEGEGGGAKWDTKSPPLALPFVLLSV